MLETIVFSTFTLTLLDIVMDIKCTIIKCKCNVIPYRYTVEVKRVAFSLAGEKRKKGKDHTRVVPIHRQNC